MLHKIENFFYAIGGDEPVYFLDDVLLEPFVKIPWLENPIRSYRLQEKDIKAMSKKGYRIFDGEIGRFVKEWPKSSRFCIEGGKPAGYSATFTDFAVRTCSVANSA